jgi:hypothetical protein
VLGSSLPLVVGQICAGGRGVNALGVNSTSRLAGTP